MLISLWLIEFVIVIVIKPSFVLVMFFVLASEQWESTIKISVVTKTLIYKKIIIVIITIFDYIIYNNCSFRNNK